jgi:hypothetical protein
MFKLTLHDRKGQELKEGDIVKVSDGRNIKFYSEVKYLPESKAIAPFHTFSFHSFEKVDKLPENAVLQPTETSYKIWYIVGIEPDEDAKDFEDYLLSWRECERLLEKNIFRIERL